MNRPKSAAKGLRLLNATGPAPEDLDAMLRELGAGDHRFRGTPFGRGECSLEVYLQSFRDSEDASKVPAGMVPQSTFWLTDDRNQAVGIVRVRHRLNERLTQYGGHIGYYIRPAARSRGYGKEALRLGLEELRRLGASRALLTVSPMNAHSMRIVLANGGVPDGQGKDTDSEEIVNRYWIELR